VFQLPGAVIGFIVAPAINGNNPPMLAHQVKISQDDAKAIKDGKGIAQQIDVFGKQKWQPDKQGADDKSAAGNEQDGSVLFEK
jgi:hypothetical protein